MREVKGRDEWAALTLRRASSGKTLPHAKGSPHRLTNPRERAPACSEREEEKELQGRQ